MKTGAGFRYTLAFLAALTACNSESMSGLDAVEPVSDARIDAGSFDSTLDAALPVQVQSVTPLLPAGGGRVDWCLASDRIAYDTVAAGVWNIHTISPDGSNDACVTCNPVPGLPAGTIIGQPAWHPSCQWLVVQVKSTTLADGAILPRYFGPGWGIHSDLYLLAADGSVAHRLVELTVERSASLHPQFSADGMFLMWSARDPIASALDLAERTTAWRGWYVAVAEVDVTASTPQLGARVDFFRTLPVSSRGFWETHALRGPTMWLSHTDNGARVVDEGYSVNVSTPTTMLNWTESPGTWEEHTMPSPQGRLVTYNSSRPSSWHNPPDEDFEQLQMELWAKVVDTGERVQLTRFNEQLTSTEIQQGVKAVTADYTWGPNGQIAVYSVKQRDGVILSQRVDVLALDDAY